MKYLYLPLILFIIIINGCQLVGVTVQQRHIVDMGDGKADKYTKSEQSTTTTEETELEGNKNGF